MTEPPFRTGDIVRLKNGESRIQVLEVDYIDWNKPTRETRIYYKQVYCSRPKPGWFIRFAYLSSLSYEHEGRKWREAEDFVLITEKETTMTLYQTKEEKPRFGTFLTKTQNGKIVLEMKGKDGDVQSFGPDEVEEVMPFTAELTRLHGGDNPNENRHYEFNKGDVEVGDYLFHISSPGVFQVIAIDTKKRQPTKSKNGFLKLAGPAMGLS